MSLNGTFYEGIYESNNLKPGCSFKYKVYIPENYENAENLGLMVTHDGFNQPATEAMEICLKRGTMPPCVSIGTDPSNLKATLEGGFNRRMRLDNYDIFDRRFPDFMVDELLPYIIKKHNLKISPSPDMHLIAGVSSGGISAFNIAWTRTDYFRRVYMSSPSFLSMNNGLEMTALMRKFETKPLRIWTEFSEDEPDDYFGSSYTVADAAERALKFANYDLNSRYYPREGHGSRYSKANTLLDIMEFLWKDWEKPIAAPDNSPRFNKVFVKGSNWEKADFTDFPDRLTLKVKNGFTYKAEGNKIFIIDGDKKEEVYSIRHEISAINISSDGWRLYIASKNAGCMYAASVLPDGKIEGNFIQAYIHKLTDFLYPGVSDIAVDPHDRIFAATEMGIQAIRSWGLIDVIAPLPNDLIPEKVTIINENEKYFLLALTENGTFKREIVYYSEIEENFPYPNDYYD